MSKDNRVNISGTVPADLAEFVETYRWANRKSRSDVVVDALTMWAKSNGYTEPKTGEVPAEGETPAAETPAETPAEPPKEAAPEKTQSRRVSRV